MTIADLNILKTMTAAYELRPDRVYVILCDGKHFSHEQVNALFRHVQEEGINFNIHIIATTPAKGLEIKEGTSQ